MEILLGTIFFVVIALGLIFIGKIKGAPQPSAMSEAAISQRLSTEEAWIFKYLTQPNLWQRASLKRMYEEKTEYVKNLKTELAERQKAEGVEVIEAELAPVIQRRAELIKDNKSESEATAQSLKEWSQKDK